MTLRTRRPTGRMSNPLILLEGETGSGRSWKAAELSASPKVNRTFWLQLGEVTADEYGLIPGTRYEIVEHDGTWAQIYQAVVDAKAEAHADREKDPRPDVFVLDTVGAVWELLSEWTYNRARSSKKAKELLAADPNAEIDISSNYWNDATARWKRMMTQLKAFPGIVILLSRGRETIYLENGRPVNGRGDYRVEGQKALASDVRVWLRMTQDLGFNAAKLIKLRTVRESLLPPTPGAPAAKLRNHGEILHDFSLEALIFDRLGYDAANAQDAHVPLQAGNEAPLSDAAMPFEMGIETAETVKQLRTVRDSMVEAHGKGEISDDDRRQLTRMLGARKESLEQQAPPPPADPAPEQKTPANDPNRRRMMALFSKAPADLGFADRATRMAFVSLTVGREVASTNQLTDDEVKTVCEALEAS